MPGIGSGGMTMVLFIPSKLTRGKGWIENQKKPHNLKKPKKKEEKMIEKPLQWLFSFKHKHSLVICRSLFHTNLKQKV
jgi:hypothetical protein